MTEAGDDRAALEGLHGPFDDPTFRADLAVLAEGAREASRRWAADAVLLCAGAAGAGR